MKTWLVVGVALLALCACFHTVRAGDDDDDEKKTKSDVLDLNYDTIDDAIKNNEHILIEFFAPWCGHCKALAPEYEKAATILAGTSDIKLAKVDCTETQETCEKYAVRGFPTVLFFKNGNMKEYSGQRTADGIVDWLRARSGPRVATLADDEARTLFASQKASSVFLVGEFPADSEGLKVFTEVANSPEAEEWLFAHVTGDKNTVTLHRPFSTEDISTDKVESAEALLSWAGENAYPSVGEVSEQYVRMTKRGLPMVLLFVNDKEQTNVDDLLAWAQPLAKASYAKASWAYVGEAFHARLPQMGASGEVIPTVVVIDNQGHKWPFDESQTFNAENVEKFVEGVLDGSISPYFRSEPVPETNDEPVKVVVGKSFDELVLKSDKDVLVEFYAPWCGHCKKLVPVYNQLGEHYKDSKGVVIAKIDAAANDNPAVQIQGFPTIYLFPASAEGKKEPVQFNDARTLEALIQFVQANRVTASEPGDDVVPTEAEEAEPEHTHDEL
jgi:protein disulfide-isomerase A1